jgi:iron complex outermembrane receptor protein
VTCRSALPRQPRKSGETRATLLSVVLLFGGALYRTMVTAQSMVVPSEEIPEIVVTAQKREQRLQDVPISIGAITGDEIDRTGAGEFKDLLLSIPGVSYSASQTGLARYSIRGISTDAANPTVGLYLDDVSLITINNSFAGAANPLLIDLDRVEVLKGPQGTLYGGSAMGGAIKFVSRKPVLDEFSVSAAVDIASVDHGGTSYSGESVLNLPLIDHRLAIRIAAAYRLDAGYINNVPNAEVQVWSESATSPPAPFVPVTYPSQSTFERSDFNERSTTMARASIEYTPSDTLTVSPIVTIQRTDQSNPDEFFTNLPDFENTARFNQPTYDDLNVYSLNVTQQLDGFSLTSLTGYVDRTIELDRDFSLYIGLLVPPLLPQDSNNVTTTNSKTLTQELRLGSTDSRSLLKWTVGIYYSHQQDDYYQSIDTVGAGTFFGSGTDLTYAGNIKTVTTQEAIFGDATYTLNARWDLNAGFRWFDIGQSIDGSFSGVFNGGNSEINDRRSTNIGITPKVSVTYRPFDDHLLYASASKGFRPGGPNDYNADIPICYGDLQRLGIGSAPQEYQSDDLWTYELGSKNEFGSRHSRINGAIYYTNWKNIQQQVTLPTCAITFTENVGAATVKGAELSADFAVASAITAGGGVSYTATRITESTLGVSAQVDQELLDTPKWTGSGYAEYEFLHAAAWRASVRADYEYHGANLRQFNSLFSVTYPNGTPGDIPDATQIQGAYHVVNANLNVSNGATHYRLYVDNLTDTAPYLDFRRAPGFSAATTLRPRTIGISVKTSF